MPSPHSTGIDLKKSDTHTFKGRRCGRREGSNRLKSIDDEVPSKDSRERKRPQQPATISPDDNASSSVETCRPPLSSPSSSSWPVSGYGCTDSSNDPITTKSFTLLVVRDDMSVHPLRTDSTTKDSREESEDRDKWGELEDDWRDVINESIPTTKYYNPPSGTWWR